MGTIYLDEFLGGQQPSRNNPQGVQPGIPGYKTIKLEDLLPASAGGMAATPEPAPFKRGLLSTGEDLFNAIGLALQTVGAQDLSQGFYQKAQQMQESRDAIPRRVPDIESIQSPKDVAVFAYETLAENAPMLASLALGAGAGSIGARVLGAAPNIVRNAAWAGSILTDVGLQTGESVGIAKQAGKNPEDFRVIGSGLGKAALDFIPFWAIARRTGLAPILERSVAAKLVEGGFLKRAAGNVATLIATEVPTETMQEYINVSLDNALKDYSGPITPGQVSQLKNAAAGAAAFGLLGIPAAIGKPNIAPGVAPPPAPPTQREAGPFPALPAPPNFVVGENGEVVPYGTKRQEAKLLPAPSPSEQFVVDAGGQASRLTESQAAAADAARSDRDSLGVVPDFIRRQSPGGRNLFDGRTGELIVPVQDYQRLLIESQRTVEYDPFQDQIIQKPSTFAPRQITPGWQATPDGQMWLLNPTGEGAESVVRFNGRNWTLYTDAGVPLGDYETAQSAQIAGGRYAKEGSQVISFRPGEPADQAAPSGHRDFISPILRFPQEERTPLENALVGIENQRVSGIDLEGFESRADPGLRAVQVNPEFTKLLSLREEIISSPNSRRTRDGQLTRDGQRRLDNLDKRISTLASKLGVPNPTVGRPSAELDKPGDVQTVVKAALDNEARAVRGSKYRNLTETEGSLLKSLEEKELVGEGLSPKEWEVLERLTSKRDGEVKVETRKQSAQEVREIAALVKARKEGLLSTLPTGASKGWTNLDGGRWKLTEDRAFYMPAESSNPNDAVAVVETTDNQSFIARVRRSEGWVDGGTYASSEEAMSAAEAQSKFRRDRSAPRGMEVSAIRDAIMPLWNAIPAFLRPRIIITSSTNTQYFPMGSKARESASRATGLYFPGKVFLLADKLTSSEEAIKTFLHEVFVHHGFSVALDTQTLRDFLKLVYKAKQAELGGTAQTAGVEPTPVNLIEAEEYVARLAESSYSGNPLEPFQSSLLDRVITLLRQGIRKLWPSLKISDREIKVMLADTGKFLTSMRTPDSHGDLFNPTSWRTEPFQRVFGKRIVEENVAGLDSFAEIWGAKAAGLFLTPLQMAERFKVPGVRSYIESVQRWWARKRDLTNDAVNIAEEWQGLPKRDMNRLAELVFKITKESDEKGRRLNLEELKSIFKELDIGESTQRLFQKVDKSFVDILNKLQNGLEFSAIRAVVSDREAAVKLHNTWKTDREAFKGELGKAFNDLFLVGRLTEIEEQIDGLRNRNYFPYSRFGRYAITIRARRNVTRDGREFKGPTEGRRGGVVAFETFDSYAARDQRISDIVHEYDSRDYHIQAGLLSDQEFVFLNMPPALFETLKGKLNLSEEQEALLRELYFVKSPGSKFLRHLTQRNGIAGMSQDALRVYSSYMMNAANHLARVEFHQDMEASISEMRKSASEMGDVAGVVRDYFGKHFDYIMNPKNDWSQLRAVGFLWYLGFNVKSAMVNLTQVPMVALPFLSSTYGEGKTSAALLHAYGTVVKWRQGKTLLDPMLDSDIKRGIAEGFIDESRATELAGLAEADALERFLPSQRNSQLLNKVSYYASYLFRHAEKFNREVVFIAARDLALQAGMSNEDAFLAGRKAVQTTMFEYAKWNRPEFMRGKKSVFFLFWNYMQHLSYLAFGGEGFKTSARIWMMLLVGAGLLGLPFAEDFLDLVDWSGTQVREALGSQDPKLDLKRDLRELAQTVTDQPDLVMHGLSRYYGLGGLHALELLGIPIPNTDVSGSLSAGRVLPGMEKLTSSEPDPDKRLGQALVDTLGPVAGIGYAFARTLVDTNPDEWKKWERAMPSALRGVSQSLRRGIRGEETFRGGGAIATFDPLDMQQRAEVVANALGFAPTRLNQVQELRSSQEELRKYWTTRRALAIENYALAVMSQDQEVLADARDNLRRYNETVVDPRLRISSDTIKRSIKARTRLTNLREQGLPAQKAFIPLYRSVAEDFPEASEELPNPELAQ